MCHHTGYADEKDSLSIKVSYIKVNISRSRKISTKPIMSSLFNQGVSFVEDRVANNEVKLSVLADIGSSSFVYDMHNIKEVCDICSY